MINFEKVEKIFEIYKELNKDLQLEYVIKLGNTPHDYKEQEDARYKFQKIQEHKPPLERAINTPPSTPSPSKFSFNKHVLVIIKPSTFIIEGGIKHLTKDVLGKILDEVKIKIDEEYVTLKLKLNDLKNRML